MLLSCPAMHTGGFNIYDVEGAIHVAISIISFVRVATICIDRAISFCRVGLIIRLPMIKAMYIAVYLIDCDDVRVNAYHSDKYV